MISPPPAWENSQVSDLLLWCTPGPVSLSVCVSVCVHEAEQVRAHYAGVCKNKTRVIQDRVMHLFSQRKHLNPPRPPNKRFLGEKSEGKQQITSPPSLVKNEHTSRCAHKSVLVRAYLRACVYELSWMCVLSLHESAVITQWRCPWGGSRYIWLRATSPHFIVSCAWQKNCCVCLSMLTDESRSVAWMCVRV